jgi:hypothetical protein
MAQVISGPKPRIWARWPIASARMPVQRQWTSSGYSAGGVVAHLWVRDGDGGDVERQVLTLGSPQHGTSQAAVGQPNLGNR